MKKLVTFIMALSLALSPCLNSLAATTQDSKTTTAATTSTQDSSTANDTAGTSGTADTSAQDTSGTSEATDVSAQDTSGTSEATDASAQESDSEKSAEETTETASETTEYTGSAYGVEDLSGAPDIVADSAIVIDAATGTVLYGKEADTKRYPASITKVMTALLAIENCKMSDVITFSSSAVNGIEAGSSTAGINVGAKLTVEDTLYALMLVSANEAGAAIAEHISGSDEEFAKLMTARAKELGCTGTNFKNPHGLPNEDHYTTAHDMALIMREALKHDEFRKISSTITYTLEKSDTLTDTLELWNHAKILREGSDYYYKYAECAKTGYTQAALNTLVTSAKKGGRELICVILKDYGADNSYYDSAKLYKWCFKSTKQVTPLSDCDFNTLITEDDSISVEKRSQIKLLNCTFDADYPVLVKKDADASSFTISFKLDEDKTTGRLGYLVISNGKTTIGETPVTYDLTSKQGKAYAAGEVVDDDLQTAPVKSKRKDAIHTAIRLAVQILIVIIVATIIIRWFRRRQLEKRRQRRIERRNHSGSSQNARSKSSDKSSGRRQGRRKR